MNASSNRPLPRSPTCAYHVVRILRGISTTRCVARRLARLGSAAGIGLFVHSPHSSGRICFAGNTFSTFVITTRGVSFLFFFSFLAIKAALHFTAHCSSALPWKVRARISRSSVISNPLSCLLITWLPPHCELFVFSGSLSSLNMSQSPHPQRSCSCFPVFVFFIYFLTMKCYDDELLFRVPRTELRSHSRMAFVPLRFVPGPL